jgi:hypothetical protein
MQNFSVNNLFNNLRGRMSAVISAVIGSVLLCICGAVMAFVMAPGQAIKASQIAKMPLMDAQTVESAAVGSDILITGLVSGSAPNPSLPDFIAYEQDEWDVTVSKNSDGTPQPPSGSWTNSQTFISELALDVNGSSVPVLSSNTVSLGGNLHEQLVDGKGSLQDQYNGKQLRDGALRYRGFFNGDLTTVYGKKASTGGVIPDELFAGDRVVFEQYQKQMASSLLLMGIGAMICSPVVLVGGVLGAAFGRRRR